MMKTFVSLLGYTEPVLSTDSSDDDCDNDSEEDVDKDKHDCLPMNLPCFAHTLQLVIRDGLKEARQHLNTVIAKAALENLYMQVKFWKMKSVCRPMT